MPPKKVKKTKRKTKQKPTNSIINKQVVIVNQSAPVKRKYTRKSTPQQQPINQFSTPENTIGQVFNLLRFIPQQSPNYDSLQNQPKPPPISLSNQPFNQDDRMSSITGSSRDLSDTSSSVSRFKDDKRTSHKPALLSPIVEEGSGGGEVKGAKVLGFRGEFNRFEQQYIAAKRRSDNYKGSDPDIIREIESNLNSAKKVYNIDRRNRGLKPV